MFPLAFVAGWLQGHWWGFISRNYVVWPTFFLMNVFIALKGSHFWFYILSFREKVSKLYDILKSTCVINVNSAVILIRLPFKLQTICEGCMLKFRGAWCKNDRGWPYGICDVYLSRTLLHEPFITTYDWDYAELLSLTNLFYIISVHANLPE